MLTVFKKYLGYLIAGECLIFALAAALYHDGAAPTRPLALAAAMSLVLLAGLEIKAAAMHQRLLGILYVWQKPGDFVTAYEPLLKQERVRRNLRFTMTAYLSNGYAAMGSFEKALAILDSAPALAAGKREAGDAILAGNRCSIYLYMGDSAKAREQYELLCRLCAGQKRRNDDISELLRIRLATSQGCAEKSDADHIREQLKAPGTALHKTELRYMLGQIYLSLGEKSFAAHYLRECAENGGDSWVGKSAEIERKTMAGA